MLRIAHTLDAGQPLSKKSVRTAAHIAEPRVSGYIQENHLLGFLPNLARTSGIGMSDQEFHAFLIAIERFNADHATPDAARQALKDEGVLTDSGEVAEPYASHPKAPA
jgi:hypothetical protein